MKTSRSLTNTIASLNRVQPKAGALPQLFYLTDDIRGADPVAMAKKLPRGSAIILRHYSHPDKARLAHKLALICKRRRLKLLIANDVRLAISVRSDGVHVPDYNLSQIPRIRSKLRKGQIITAATHSLRRIHMAGKMKADAAMISPVFPTRSHDFSGSLGVFRLRAISRNSPLPLIALGGISSRNIAQLKNMNLHGIAAITALEKGARF